VPSVSIQVIALSIQHMPLRRSEESELHEVGHMILVLYEQTIIVSVSDNTKVTIYEVAG